MEASCPWCVNEEEDSNLILWKCEPEKWVWDYIVSWWSVQDIKGSYDKEWFRKTTKECKGKLTKQVWGMVSAAVLWTLWLNGNQLVFSGTRCSKKDLLSLLIQRIDKWALKTDVYAPTQKNLWRVNPIGGVLLRSKDKVESF